MPHEEQIEDITNPEMKRWMDRVRRARKLRKDWERDFKVEQCEKFYLGKQNVGTIDARVLNHFLSIIRVTQPNLLFDDPKFLIRSRPGRSPIGEREAAIAEGILESIAKQDQNLQNASSLALLQNFFRIAVLKIIYDPKLEPNPRSGEVIFDKDAVGNPIINPEMGELTPMLDPSTGQPMTEPELIISDEAYRWEWVDARKILLPNEGPDSSKWTWIGEEIEVTLEEAREDERFPQEFRDRLKPSGKDLERDSADMAKRNFGQEPQNPDDELVHYVEIYDIKHKRWLILPEDQDFFEPLLDEPLPEGIEDHPYAIMPGWIPILGPDPLPWPLPYTQPWLDPQTEYNIRRQQMMEGAKRSARKILYEESTFADSDEALKALQSPKDMEAAMVRDVGRPPKMMETQDLNPAIYNDIPVLLNDYRIISGQTGAKLGSPGADTATEASFVERASQLRDSDLQKAVIIWLRIAGKKMLQRVKATLTLDYWVKLRGMDDKAVNAYLTSVYKVPPELLEIFPSLKQGIIQRFGQEKAIRITREDLQFEADVDVQPGSTRPRSLAVERQQWLEFLQIIGSAPQLALSRELLAETARKYEFISDRVVEELHLFAVQMMQAQQATAGRGGQGTSVENTAGTTLQNGNALAGQLSQGFEQV